MPQVRVNKMISDAEAAEIARNTWEASDAGQEERRRQRRWANPEIGDVMPDGTIYAGMSPDTGKQMFVTAQDAPMRMDFNSAAKYAKKLDAHGHQDWGMPTKAELNVLFQNRERGALAGTFNLTGSLPAGWYWSGTPYDNDGCAYGQRFSDGHQFYLNRNFDSSVRCVR